MFSKLAEKINKVELDNWFKGINEALEGNRCKKIDTGCLYRDIDRCKSETELYELSYSLYNTCNLGQAEDLDISGDIIFKQVSGYYHFKNAVKLSISNRSMSKNRERNSSWSLKDMFSRLNNSGIRNFIIDIKDIDKDIIVGNNNKAKLLGYTGNGTVTGRYCILISREWLLFDGDIAWNFIIIYGKEGGKEGVHMVSIVPDLLPLMYVDDTISYPGVRLGCKVFSFVPEFYISGWSNGSRVIQLLYRYDKDRSQHTAIYNKHEIVDHFVFDAQVFELTKKFRDNVISCMASRIIDIGLDDLINNCFYAIDRYIIKNSN